MRDLQKFDLQDVQYHILPAKRLAGGRMATLHDKVFNFFVHRWQQAFNDTEKTARPAPGWEDHFLKQDLVTALTVHDQVVAAHLYTIYDLSAASTRHSEYFSFIEASKIQRLRDQEIMNVLTMEYLCVDPAMKNNPLETSFGKVITALGAKLTESFGLDAALGTPIKSIKADKMMENMGGLYLQKDLIKYGYAVDLLYIPTKPCRESLDPKVARINRELWLKRQIYTNEFFARMAA